MLTVLLAPGAKPKELNNSSFCVALRRLMAHLSGWKLRAELSRSTAMEGGVGAEGDCGLRWEQWLWYRVCGTGGV